MYKGFYASVAFLVIINCSLAAFGQAHSDPVSALPLPQASPTSAPTPQPQVWPSPSVSPLPQPSPPQKAKSLERQFFKNIVRDQAAFWTSPFRIGKDDAKWLAPVGAAAAALIATDRHTSGWVSRRGSLPGFSGGVSFVGSNEIEAALIGGVYIVGRATKNARARETGVLAAQALINAKLVTYALKAASRRPRPNFDDGRGRFFKGGRSFPSGHASNAWAVATVISYEYKSNPLIRYGSLAAAAAVTMSRYSGRNHFLSDVVVGSVIGFLIGRYVFKKHHVSENVSPGDDDPGPTTTH